MTTGITGEVKDFAFRTGSAISATGIQRAEYNGIEAVNHSVLKMFRRSPAHALAAMRGKPREPTDKMKLGTAAHCRVLTPDLYESTVFVAPECDRRTKDGKATWAAFVESVPPGATVITSEQSELVSRIAQAIHAHPLAARLCVDLPGDPEVGLMWPDAGSGVWCKGIADRIVSISGGAGIIDIKTTQHAGPVPFGRQAANESYHTQLAFYRRGVAALRNGEQAVCLIVAVENEEPHGVAVYDLSAEQLDAADKLIDGWLAQYAALKDRTEWPSYPQEVTSLRLPPWALQPEEVVSE